jgi:tRNA modification GTPase
VHRPADTIAAIATPPGRGAIAIVRISGPQAAGIAEALTGIVPEPRRATVCEFHAADGDTIDQGLMLFFQGPRSFTGEDVVELHGHGGTVVSDAVLAAVLERGARLADPGEFALRAFINDKLDLPQAEAIADLIDSGSQLAARAAMRSLLGQFSEQVNAVQAGLTELRVQLEASLDFPDEELDIDADGALSARFGALAERLDTLLQSARQGAVLQSGLSVVIAGPPNAGKSSLLNRLAGYDAAIVTPIAGTTRDLLRERIAIDGLPINLVDTAGLRSSEDPIEAEGIRRSFAAAARADRLLWVVDIDMPLDAVEAELLRQFPAGPPATIVRNKIDLLSAAPESPVVVGLPVVWVSALTGQGLPELIAHLKQVAGLADDTGGTISARTRHIAALHRAADALERARTEFAGGRAVELAAEELRAAQQALGELTGEFSSDDLLGEVFASFCIGK